MMNLLLIPILKSQNPWIFPLNCPPSCLIDWAIIDTREQKIYSRPSVFTKTHKSSIPQLTVQ